MTTRLTFLALTMVSFSLAISDSIHAENWPQFRGPDGNGHATSKNLPLKWSESENVTWKIPIHDRGYSSPVIWESQIWMTTGTADGSKLYAICVDRDSGKTVHDLHLFDVEKPEHCAPTNSYASPTPVIEAGRVYAHFGTNGTACIDTASGKVLWTRRDLKCEHEQAAGSSPMLFGDLFVVHVDGRDVQYVIALDKFTGKTIWKSDRSIDYSRYEAYQRKGYCMPAVVPRGEGKQLVSPGAKALISYDPATGKELWKARHEGWSMAPRPLYGHGLVFAVIDYDHPELWAVRPDGNGDVTDSHIAWKITKTIPSRPSFLLVGEHLYLVNSDGIATCVEAKTGNIVWKERIAGKYSASPIYADSRVYFFSELGVTTVIKAAPIFEVLSTNSLDEQQLSASPAAVDDALFIRTESYLYRIENRKN